MNHENDTCNKTAENEHPARRICPSGNDPGFTGPVGLGGVSVCFLGHPRKPCRAMVVQVEQDRVGHPTPVGASACLSSHPGHHGGPRAGAVVQAVAAFLQRKTRQKRARHSTGIARDRGEARLWPFSKGSSA